MSARRTVLMAPWREQYLRAMAAADAGGAAPPTIAGSTGCFLRDYWLAPEQDEPNHVVLRRTDAAALALHERAAPGVRAEGPLGGLVLLNLYPYSNGHLMACLGEGRLRLLDYSPAQRIAFWRLVDDAMAILERALEPQGVNLGINQGKAAGAGAPGHLHAHLVPRWAGDVNFMTTVGEVRVIPSAMETMARACRSAWEAIREERDASGGER